MPVPVSEASEGSADQLLLISKPRLVPIMVE